MKYYLVVDVETAGKINEPLVYDIGFAIVDAKGRIYEEHSYILSEVFFYGKDTLEVSKLMESAYYSEKLPLYYAGIKNGVDWKIAPLKTIQQEINDLLERYSVHSACAYNAGFDIKALNNTVEFVTEGAEQFFFPCHIPVHCIWHMACQTICNSKRYREFCHKNGFVSRAGNIKTNAQTVWAYLSENPSFEEAHTGLEDVRIETAIMAKSLRYIGRKIDRRPNGFCWKIPQKRKK